MKITLNSKETEVSATTIQELAKELGMPEAQIPLANATLLLATAPKSNAAYCAINSALADVQNIECGDFPRHLQNKHFDGEDAKVKGQHYLYPHSFPNHYVEQQYLPDRIKNKKYYKFGDNATEQKFAEYWNKIKKNGK